MSGWIATRIGRKRFYMGCVVLFTLSSLFCGLAPNLGLLIFFRVLQGVGGGGLQPSEQAILADTFEPQKRAMAFAVYGVAVVMAPAIGPTLGGWITDNFSWRWIFFINIPVGIVSLILTSRLVEDPPHLQRQRTSGVKIDYVGLGLLTVGLGLLQVVLDKGQRDDWFESNYILAFSIISAVCLIAVIFWELRSKAPIVDFRLLKDRTFFMANVMMFMVGFSLLSSTVLLPLFLQTLMGYSAQDAGMVLSPGGLAIMMLMPMVGVLVTKYDARYLIALGLIIVSLSLLHMTAFNLYLDFKTAMLARIFQAAGLAFLFVPINTVAFSSVPPEKNNAASGLINLSRNIGGSVGISLVTTVLARRTQFHQNVLGAHINPANPEMQSLLARISANMMQHGASAADATTQAYGVVYNMVIRQSAMLAYIDDFKMLSILVGAMVPFVFLMKSIKAKKGAAAGH
jgi:DHA2 family multidrug resistance protein